MFNFGASDNSYFGQEHRPLYIFANNSSMYESGDVISSLQTFQIRIRLFIQINLITSLKMLFLG